MEPSTIIALFLASIGTFYMIWYTQRGPASVFGNEKKLHAFISMAVKQFQYVLMGHASGDAKKTAKAKTLVASTLVNDVLPRLNPILGLIVNNTELGDWMLEDADNTGAVVSILVDWFGKSNQQGLNNLLEQFVSGSLGNPQQQSGDGMRIG